MKSKVNNLLLNNKRNIIILLSFLALITFGGSLFNGFTFDDTPFVVENSLIKSVSNLPKIWTTNFNFGYKDANMGLYRPTINTLYTFCYMIGKDNPLFFHLLNIIFHVICSYLLYLLISIIFRNNLLALIASLLFLLSPIHSEAVNGISRLSESVSTCFLLLSFIYFIKYLRFVKKRFKYSLLMLLFMFLALTSKESSITIIFIFVIYDFFSEEKMALSKRFKHLFSHYIVYIFILGVFVIYLLIKNSIVGTIANSTTLIWDFMENPFSDYNFIEQMLTSLSLITIYIYKMIFPFVLSCDYSYNNLEVVNSFLSVNFIISILIICSSIYLIKYFLKKDTNCIVLILFFWSTYFVISNMIVLIGTNFAERLIYLPSIAFLFFNSILDC